MSMNRLQNLTPPTETDEEIVGPCYRTVRNNRPQMGFSFHHRSGKITGFPYCGISYPDYDAREGREFISFVYCGSAVTIEGQNIREFHRHIMRHTLMEMHEHDGSALVPGQPVFIRIAITDAREMMRGPAVALVK